MEFRTHASLDAIPAAKWDALHGGDDPFICHAFLAGLEQHGCLRRDWGWTPMHAALWEGDTLLAAAPGYIKHNSHGEFVFDHDWAQAMEHAGRNYYPKWLFAVPYTPVTGPRWLTRHPDLKAAMIGAIAQMAARMGLISLHATFLDAHDTACTPHWLARTDVHFHWRNDSGWRCFDDHLAAMESRKRKNIRRERAHVSAAGITFRILHGDEACDADIATMHALYLRTFNDKGNSAALTLDFFRHLARAMPRSLVLVLAQRSASGYVPTPVPRSGGDPCETRSAAGGPDAPSADSRDPQWQTTTIAGALFLRGGDTLHGRYWGSFETVPGLHFETCYHQGIEYCLRHGLRLFDPGAQGEHKLARGFLPVLTHSRHHFLEPGLDAAFARWCADEHAASERYRAALQMHSPYRREAVA